MEQNAPLLTKAETCQVLKVSLRTLDRWHKDGTLVPIKLTDSGRAVRYRREDIQAFIERQAASA